MSTPRLADAPPVVSRTAWSIGAMPQRRADHGVDLGVHLPFIAPTLCGVRVRSNRGELEFILPNPSGGRGVYVAAWGVVSGFADPTLHDTLLVGRLSGRDAIGPADVRQAACEVALAGHAGHAAGEAAQLSLEALTKASLRLRAHFLRTLIRLAGFQRAEDEASCLTATGFNRLAARLGWHGPQLADAIEQLSVQLASVVAGPGRTTPGGSAAAGSPHDTSAADRLEFRPSLATGRWGKLLALVQQLRLSLAEEQFSRSGPDSMTLGRIIVATDRCIRLARDLLPEIDALLIDPRPALEAWRDGVAHGVPAWLDGLESVFDGWDRICLVWFDARTPRARRSLIPEIATLAGATGAGEGWSPPGKPGAGRQMPGEAGQQPWSDELGQMVTRNERIRMREITLEIETAWP
ncbi:hypothetical protein [Lichenicola sp.]|uniref:hypothetical protein n=1 Tax=Lichenicola sp. TaxID=2804529 RepID=UPI003B002E52